MANENSKDFNAMLHKETDMPKVQIITDEAVIRNMAERKCSSPRRLLTMKS